jgi:hypothetical protein
VHLACLLLQQAAPQLTAVPHATQPTSGRSLPLHDGCIESVTQRTVCPSPLCANSDESVCPTTCCSVRQLWSARARIGSTEHGPPPAALSADFRITRTRGLTLTETSLHFRLCSISSRLGSPSSWHKVSSPSIAVSHQHGPAFGHHALIGQHGPAGSEHLGSSHWTAFGQLALDNIWPAGSEHLGSSHWTAFGQLTLDSIWSASIGQHLASRKRAFGQLALDSIWAARIGQHLVS